MTPPDAVPAGQEPGRDDAPRGGRLLSFADQVLSGLSNFVAIALVARSLQASDFGRFSLSFALLLIVLGLLRGLWGTRISLTPEPGQTLAAARDVLGAAVLAAPLLAVVVGVPSLLLSGLSAWGIVVVLAVATPLVVLQDLCRFAAVASGRPLVACSSDGVWLAVMVVAYVVRPDGLAGIGAWLLGAVLGLGVAVGWLRLWPSLTGGWRVLRTRHRTGEGVALSNVALTLASYGVLALSSLAVGAFAAGSLRGASSMMAPINTVFAFITMALLPMLHRRPAATHGAFLSRLAGLLLAVVAAWGAVLLFVPPTVGELLLGESWAGARGVLPWTVLEYLFLAVGAVGVLGLQAREEAWLLIALGWLAGGLIIAGAVVAAVVTDSAWVFAAIQAGAACFGACAVWVSLLRLGRAPG